MYQYSEDQLKAMGVAWLPRNLEEAIDAFETDPLSKAVFGETLFKAYVDYRRQVWREYRTYVSDRERKRYLKFF